VSSLLAPSPAASASVQRSARAAVAEHRSEGGSELFGISELCSAFGITPRALRFYESKGLLAPRRVGATRVYTRRDRARLALILRSKAIGATLAEIKHYLDLYGAHGEGRVQQLRYVLARTDRAVAELQAKRAHLDALLAELRVINAEVRRHLEDKQAEDKQA
jgi:DNA-binding transcriptional MerR regulator